MAAAAAAVGVGAGAARTTTVLHMPPSPSSLYDPHRRHVGYDAYGAGSRQLLFYRPHQHHQPSTVVLDSVPVRLPTTPGQHAEPPPPVVASSAAKRVRLFGVNLDCAGSEEENGGRGGWRTTPTQDGLPSPPSSSSSSSGKARCSLNLDL